MELQGLTTRGHQGSKEVERKAPAAGRRAEVEGSRPLSHILASSQQPCKITQVGLPHFKSLQVCDLGQVILLF